MAKKNREDDLAEAISESLNSSFKDGKIAFMGHEDTPTDLKDFISTGSSVVDIAISNRPHGGIPLGRITELSGLEGSGKSLMAAHMMKSCQEKGGVAVLIDTETAVNWEFFDAIGLNRDKNFVYVATNILEDIFDIVVNVIEKVRRSNKDIPVVIVIDSIAGATTKTENESDFEKDGYNTEKSIVISKAMRKITRMIGEERISLVITNQLRYKMNAMPFGDPYITPGGKAIPFHSSVRLRLSYTGKIKKTSGGNKEVVGVTAKAKIVKSRLGPGHREASFDIYFDRGIDDYASWITFLKKAKVMSGRSNALKYKDDSGEEHKFSETEFPKYLEERPELKEELYSKMCDEIIMSYSSEGLTSEDVSVEEINED